MTVAIRFCTLSLHGVDGCRAGHQICGIFASRITLAHFPVSSRMSLLKSAGQPGSTMPPNSAKRAFSLGSASPLLISALSFSMIALRSEEHTSELQSRLHLVCRLL